MHRGILFLLLLLLPFGCANNVTGIQPEPVMLVSFSVKGEISNSPDLNYYFVVNASDLSSSRDRSAGPTMNGPFPRFAPNPGWNLPFYRDYRIDPGSSQTLRDTVWTDYFQLSTEAGTFIMRHGQWPNPLENMEIASGSTPVVPTIYPDNGRLQRGKDWDIKDGTITLTLPYSTFLGATSGTHLYNSNAPEGQKVALPSLNINFAVAGRDGAVIDFPMVNPNEYLTVPTRLGAITDAPITFPLKNAANIPAGVSPDSAQLTHYRIEIKSF